MRDDDDDATKRFSRETLFGLGLLLGLSKNNDTLNKTAKKDDLYLFMGSWGHFQLIKIYHLFINKEKHYTMLLFLEYNTNIVFSCKLNKLFIFLVSIFQTKNKS